MVPNTDGRMRRTAVLSVMIVDPDWESARQFAGYLASAQVMIVGSVAEAERVLQQRVPDLILTELDLPDNDGVRFVRAIHHSARTRHVLLVVVTRRDAIQEKIAALQAGADDFLVKPVDAQQFIAHVRAVSRFRQVLKR